MRNPFLALVLTSLLLSGCGYTTRSALPPSVKTIHVAPFVNKIDYTTQKERTIYFPLLEVEVHKAIVDRFLFDGNLKIAEPEWANLSLKGELLGYERLPLRYKDNEQDVEEFRLHVIVNLELWDNRHNEMLWREDSFVGEATYFVSGPLAKSEIDAVKEALTDLARRVVERTIENW